MAEQRCKYCSDSFERNGRQDYCSIRCRNRNKRANPENLAKEKAQQRSWQSRNREKLNAYSRKHYPAYALARNRAYPWISLLHGAKRRAKIKNMPFTLTPEWAASKWTGRCELTNIPFSPAEKRVRYKNRNLSPSIDRIDSDKGYIPENCRFILWAINSFKRDGRDEEMFFIARVLAKETVCPSDFLALPG